MADVRLGFTPLSRWADRPPPRDLDTVADRLSVLSDLAHLVPWEIELPGAGLRWFAPVTSLLGGDLDHGSFWLPGQPDEEGGRAVRAVGRDELGDVLLGPIVECVRAGMVWDRFEMVQELLAPDGSTHQLMIRAVTVPDAEVQRCFGIVAEVTDTEEVPWVTADVAERLQLLVEHSPDGVIVHQDGVIVYANPAAARMAGLDSPGAGIGRQMLSFVHPDYVEGIITRLIQMSETGGVMKGYEVVMIRPDGTELPVEVASVRTSWGNKQAFQVILHDVSERRRAERAALAQKALERRYAAAVAVLEEGVIVVDGDGNVQAANESAHHILGGRLKSGVGDQILTGGRVALHEDGTLIAAQSLPIATTLASGAVVTHMIIGVTDDEGREQWLTVSSRPLGAAHGDDGTQVVCSVSDMTERKRLVDRLAWEARNDPLTGLANRSGFLAVVQDALDSGAEDLVIYFVDVDRFKIVNDSLGHAAGDEVLLAVAGRLSVVLPPTSTLSRLHGDEFAALERGGHDEAAVRRRAEELRAAVNRPLRLSSGRTVSIAVSIGVVRLEGTREAAGLLQDADMAMLKAKDTGRGRVAFFDVALREELGNRVELEDDLRAAIARGELRLEYQPVATLGSEDVVGLEALVRWDHPRRGPVPPLRFVKLAEESDLIVSLGRYVLTEGCVQMARWRTDHAAARGGFVAINLSPRQLDGDTLLPALLDALAESGLPPDALVLEITESGFVSEDPAVRQVFDEVRAVGVRLAIDDFGTGYSSLSYLKRLPVSFLKVDRSFVMGLGEDDGDEHIVKAVTELGHGLGLGVIAEGVETETQRRRARALGCDLYQGYLLARPARPEVVRGLWLPAASNDG